MKRAYILLLLLAISCGLPLFSETEGKVIATQASPSSSLSLALRGKLGLLHGEPPFGFSLITEQ